MRKGTRTVKTCSKKCFSINRKGIVINPEWRRNMSLSKIGKKLREESPSWKGGVSNNQSNFSKKLGKYTYTRQLTRCYKKKNGRIVGFYRKTHRVVMEQFLGRPLKPTEIVHHINHDPLDNRLENLILFKNNREHLNWHKFIRHQKTSCGQ